MSKGHIKFWGVRGSYPTPEKDKMAFGGDTSCVEIRTHDNDLIILDMGTGIRNLGKAILNDKNYPKEINIVLSHYHWDHIMGFFSFAPLYSSEYTVNIYGYNKNTPIELLRDTLINKHFWPSDEDNYKAKINFIGLPHESNEANYLEINTTKLHYSIHPHPNGTNSLKVEIQGKSITYITDCEHPLGKLNPNVLEIADGSDILIHDAHFTINDLAKFKGYGHSSWKQAVDVATISHSKQLILFHFCPEYDDQQVKENEKNAQKKFINTLAAYQGLKIEL